MKNVLIATVFALGTAGSAFAYASNELPATYAFEARTYVPNADFSNLTPTQVNQIMTVLSSNSYDNSDIPGALRTILNQ